MPKLNFSKRSIEAIKPVDKLRTFIDTNEKKLQLRVGVNNSSMIYYLNYTRRSDNRRVNFKIGPISQWDVPSARAEAKRLLAYISTGGCPQTDKHREKLQDLNTLESFLPHSGLSEEQQSRVTNTFPAFLNKPMTQLTPEALSRYRLSRLKQGVKPQTLNRDRNALVSALNKAVEQELIPVNPLKKWKALKVEQEQGYRYLEEAERPKLMAALAQSQTPAYLRCMVLVAINTGLRRGEFFQLRYKDLTLNGKNPRIDLRAGITKARKSRSVPLNKSAVKAFKDYFGAVTDSKDGGRALFMKDSNGLVFTSPGTWDEPLTTINTSWLGLMERAGIEGLTFHHLRHTCASYLVQAGIDLYTVKEILGHSSIKMTERYSHLAPKATTDALAKLDNL